MRRFLAIAVSAAVLLLWCLTLPASPSKRGLVWLYQPDGTSFQAVISGDEHFHVVRALDGCCLIQQEDGFWCYCEFTPDGKRSSSHCHYKGKDVPQAVISRSLDLPFETALAHARERRMEVDGKRLEDRLATRAGGAIGTRHALVILVEFPDLPFRYGKADFETMLTSGDPASALSYFNDQWNGILNFKIDVTDVVSLPESYKYYGANDEYGVDSRPQEMVSEACTLIDDLVDFSIYDNDGDGSVDNVFIFFAGPDEAEGAGEYYLWSHQWYLSSAKVKLNLDGVKIDNYACSAELKGVRWNSKGVPVEYQLAGIGTFCHEYTHSFGIPDLYDVDSQGSGGYSEGMWSTIDLMDSGNRNDNCNTPPNYSAMEKFLFGISSGKPMEEGSYTLAPGEFLVMEADNGDEIFLVECRDKTGWDRYIGGRGLLVYHLDMSGRPAGNSTRQSRVLTWKERWSLNELNANPAYQGADILEPDPSARQTFQAAMAANPPDYVSVQKMASHAFWPWGTANTFSPSTKPAFVFHGGAESPLAITDMVRDGETGNVSFNVVSSVQEKAPSVVIDDQLTLQDVSILRWSAGDIDYSGNSYIRFNPADDSPGDEIEVPPYSEGHYAYVMDGLEPYTAYKVQLYCKIGGIPGPVNTLGSFTTKAAPAAGSLPYIYLSGTDRYSDGSFKKGTAVSLRVYNAPEYEGIRWYQDDAEVFPSADGYYVIDHSCDLKAVIYGTDGKFRILTKRIEVR